MYIYTDNACNQEVFQILFPQFVQEAKCDKSVQLVEKECGIKYCVFKKHTALSVIKFSQFDISIVLYILWYRIEVLTVVRIHNVWVRTPYSLVHGYECFGGALWNCTG